MAEPTLFVTDAEMIRRLGVPEKVARAAIRALDLDRGSGFPQKQRLWGDRRYWPAVQQWCDRKYGGRFRDHR
ncbi:winged helix-turn-helix domain-containing protein [Bradyrhizobium oligotrophicum]|uniref:winged helix-turn-helix domain-containing protein n=1 Tax=Bradyrhizobium oligotrophicum TaxID=44255 RepID=UPI003EC0B8A9